MEKTLAERLTGTMVGAFSGIIGTLAYASGQGYLALQDKFGIFTTQAMDLDAAIDAGIKYGPWILGVCVATGLAVDAYRNLSDLIKEKRRK